MIYYTIRDNGIKSTVEFQIGLIKLRKNEEQLNDYMDIKEINSQEEKLELGSLTKQSSKNKETSIEKREKKSQSKGRSKPRNISLPNLKKKPSKDIKDRRLRFKKRKTNVKQEEYAKDKHEKWGDVFFHYFEEILDRFIKRKLEVRKKPIPTGRGRLFS